MATSTVTQTEAQRTGARRHKPLKVVVGAQPKRGAADGPLTGHRPGTGMVLEAGASAPDFSIDAVVSGKKVSQANGKPTVLVFHGNKTQDAPKEVGKAVRAAHPGHGDVLVANIVNLKAYSGLFKKAAEAMLKQTYEKMAGKVEPPEEYVVLCPDWANEIGPAFGVQDSDKAAAIVVLDGDGTVLASAQGDALGAAAVAALN